MQIFNSITSDDETSKILNVGRIPMPEGILFFFLLLAGASLGAKFGAYIVEQDLQNIEHGNTFFIIASIGGAGGMVSAILLVLARLLWKKIAPDRYNKALKE